MKVTAKKQFHCSESMVNYMSPISSLTSIQKLQNLLLKSTSFLPQMPSWVHLSNFKVGSFQYHGLYMTSFEELSLCVQHFDKLI